MNPLHSQKGFTLVELMVVVAMVGVLSAIAIPQYDHYVAKARQTEAKVELAGIYMAEMSFFAENNSYTTCLRRIGFVPEGATQYYFVGFSSDVGGSSTCGPDGTWSCARYNFAGTDTSAQCDASDPMHPHYSDVAFAYTAAIPSGGYYYAPWNQHLSPTGGSSIPTSVSTNTFLAGAVGAISRHPASTALWCHPTNVNSGRCLDGWSIDQNKVLKNTNSGI